MNAANWSNLYYIWTNSQKRLLEKELCFDDDTVGASRDMVSARELSSEIRSALVYRANKINMKMLPSAARLFGGDTPQPSLRRDEWLLSYIKRGADRLHP